ncbi:MAG: sigma 54-interacting transcriptional regulator [Polyangiaceae bacterium]|nr:sigma 54-interacting transcriptional regulator [Polyangiaceae bacterium]
MLASDHEALLRAARDAWLSGEDERCRAALAQLAATEPALAAAARAAAAAYADDSARAQHWLTVAARGGGADVDALRLAALATLAERGDAPDPAGDAPTGAHPMLAAEAALAAASIARRRGRGDLARRALAALSPGDPLVDARAEEERGALLAMEGDPRGAKLELERAIVGYAAAGARRAGGRALLRYARAVAPMLPDGGGAATWLARARAELGDRATARDRGGLREGFRLHGRRLPDAALGERTLSRLQSSEAAAEAARAAALLAEERAPGDDALVELGHTLARQTREIEAHAGELLEILAASAVEHGRLQALARALAPLDRVDDRAEFAAAAAAVIAEVVQADNALVAVRGAPGALDLVGAFSTAKPPGPERYRAAMEAALLAAPSTPPGDGLTREESRPRGPMLAVAVRAGGVVGALYVDKHERGGQLRDADLHLLHLASELLAQGLARIAAHASEKAAFAELAATLDAIRDGVVAIDAAGVIRSSNAACARMLRVADGLVGRHVDDLPQLAPLLGPLRGGGRLDGAVVRLAHGSVVVTARPIAAGRGVVATLVELDRAQRMALKITHGKPRYSFADILGSSATMRAVVRLARQVADVDASVLITGESGTGKEVLAQAIHTGSARASEPFVGINCAALPRELLEAELFGYDRGAFTGARSEGAPGKFELAGDGTILLDEIGDMPLDMQVKLLRVLQERVVVRLGGSSERAIGARVIATTHRDLDALVERGAFRLDLLYRLRVLHLHVPPLRDRDDDVLELVDAFTARVAAGQKKPLCGLSAALRERLAAYHWPGNVRELANVIEREVSLAPVTATTLDALQVPLGASARDGGFASESPSSRRAALKASTPAGPAEVRPLAEVEKRAYLEALSAFSGNVSRAAKALGVSRATFYVKLREYDVNAIDEPGPETLRKIRFVEGKKRD